MINTKDKVLSISHYDLDGVGCQIVLANYFKNISFLTATYTNIDNILENVKFLDYDIVYITDISPSQEENIDHKNVVLLDHHETAKQLNKPNSSRFIVTENSATVLTKNYIENTFKCELNNINNFVYLVNDYDMWIFKNKKSKMLNELLNKYGVDKFRREFVSGRTRFNQSEIKYIREKMISYKDILDKLEIFEFEKIDACLFVANEFINDLCEEMLKKYSIAIAHNSKNNHVSLRNRTDIHLGNILKELNIGGGHGKACGLKKDTNDFIKESLYKLEDFLFDNYKQVIKG